MRAMRINVLLLFLESCNLWSIINAMVKNEGISISVQVEIEGISISV